MQKCSYSNFTFLMSSHYVLVSWIFRQRGSKWNVCLRTLWLWGIEDEFYGRVTDDGLRRAQTTLRRNKEISLLVTIGFYVLNIIDANVDAHLQQFNVDDNLSFEPVYERSPIDGSNNFGLGLNFKF